MPGLASYQHTMDIESITIDRENRQRVEIDDLTGLISDISRHGLLNPIIVSRKDKKLIAGERRLTSYKTLAAGWAANNPGAEGNPWSRIPFRYYDELDEFDAQVVELSENLHRKELPWRNMATTIYKIHGIRLNEDENHTQSQTAAELGMTDTAVSINLAVGEAIAEGKLDFSGCVGVQAAYNIIKRAADRETDAMLADLNFAATKQAVKPAVPAQPKPTPLESFIATRADGSRVEVTPGVGQRELKPEDEITRTINDTPVVVERKIEGEDEASRTIIQADFLEFAASYAEQPFNFLHIDFPYGINFGESKRQNSASDRIAYDDSPDLFWELCRALRDAKDTLIADSAHIMFWFSLGLEPEHPTTAYERIAQFFRAECGFRVEPFPLIWCRNGSILPDPNRGPRRGYETAFLMTRGDRKVVKPVQNYFEDSNRSEKGIHHSEKPQGMLEHYLGMLVDGTTRMLDPTCGSGSAIRAARKYNPAYMLGIEQNAEFAKFAQEKFRAECFKSELLGDL